jgi:hypothetical protein
MPLALGYCFHQLTVNASQAYFLQEPEDKSIFQMRRRTQKRIYIKKEAQEYSFSANT